MRYQDDANGDALRRLKADGDDLTRPRDVEFTVVFPNEDAAKRFADHFSALGYKASVEFTQTVAALPWDVVVVKNMIPSYDGIGAFEKSLQRMADVSGGRADGWGCLSP